MRYLVPLLCIPFLIACGGPSQADVQATVVVAVQETAQAQAVATSVQATHVAADACGTEAIKTYDTAIQSEIDAFAQQAELVGATPRVSLGAPLQRLLDIQTETRKLSAPECLHAFHERVLAAMKQHQSAYQDFAAQKDETEVSNSIQLAAIMLNKVQADLKDIQSGKISVEQATPTPKP